MISERKNGEWMYLRRITQNDSRGDTRFKTGEGEKETLKGEFLLCRNCGHIIANSLNKVDRNGKYHHTFTNPGGYVFRIGCFSKAPGTLNQGELTDQYSWFSGFSWCYTHCSKCFNHLGWFFQAGEDQFFGLILDRLIETGIS